MFEALSIIALLWLGALTVFIISEFNSTYKITDLQDVMINNLVKIDNITDDQIESLRNAVIDLYDKLEKMNNKDVDEK